MHLPPGAAGMISSVTPCPEPPSGQEWNCGDDSLVGHSTSTSGLGGSPFSLGGRVYLTTGYKGAPFGLLVVTPADAGPFHLGNVNVRSRIFVDRNNASGDDRQRSVPRRSCAACPSQLKQINVTVDRENFEFNPTNCSPLSTTATIVGSKGASANVSNSYGVQNCTALPFKPTLTASTKGNASKVNGAELVVKVTSSPGQANIAKTKLVLPLTLPSRLTTIQKACLAAVFEANSAGCAEGSNIGYGGRAHPGPQGSAVRTGLPRLARQRRVPGRRVRAVQQGRHRADPRWSDRHQKRHHHLDLQRGSRRAGQQLRSDTSRGAALGADLERAGKQALQPVRPETRHPDDDHRAERRGRSSRKRRFRCRAATSWARRTSSSAARRSSRKRSRPAARSSSTRASGQLRKAGAQEVRPEEGPQKPPRRR